MQSATIGTDTDLSTAAMTQRKVWRKPEPTLLQIEDTAHNVSTGNDGNGPTTHS